MPFRDHEKELTNDPTKTTSDQFINILLSLLRKNNGYEDFYNSVVKTLIAFANKRPNVCNALVKVRCPRLLLQIMDREQSSVLVADSMDLLK